jgi:hypothetical protein
MIRQQLEHEVALLGLNTLAWALLAHHVVQA